MCASCYYRERKHLVPPAGFGGTYRLEIARGKRLYELALLFPRLLVDGLAVDFEHELWRCGSLSSHVGNVDSGNDGRAFAQVGIEVG